MLRLTSIKLAPAHYPEDPDIPGKKLVGAFIACNRMGQRNS